VTGWDVAWTVLAIAALITVWVLLVVAGASKATRQRGGCRRCATWDLVRCVCATRCLSLACEADRRRDPGAVR
jgi:hypothetical protein